MTNYCPKCGQPLTKTGAGGEFCPTHPAASAPARPTIVPKGGGYYDVVLGGVVMNEKGIRGEDAARDFADSL